MRFKIQNKENNERRLAQIGSWVVWYLVKNLENWSMRIEKAQENRAFGRHSKGLHMNKGVKRSCKKKSWGA